MDLFFFVDNRKQNIMKIYSALVLVMVVIAVVQGECSKLSKIFV